MSRRLTVFAAQLAIAALAAVVLAPIPAEAKRPLRRIGISVDHGEVQVTSGFRDVFTEKVRKKMKSGLPTRLSIRVGLERRGKRKPVTFWARNIEIVYNLWEERFLVTFEDRKGRRSTRVETVDDAVGIAGILWKTPVASTENLEPGAYRVRAVIEANPVSEEMLENIRRWLSRPSDGPGGTESRSNFFGSFVGFFVDREIGEADKKINFVSQWFELGSP
ncbi:MAG: DUF4390 domain-containing protein [Polyangia bacterium]